MWSSSDNIYGKQENMVLLSLHVYLKSRNTVAQSIYENAVIYSSLCHSKYV